MELSEYVKAGKKREIWWEPQLEGKSLQGWEISLFARPATVRTNISSQPVGARVIVNRKEVGLSPVSLDLPVGISSITLKMNDYFTMIKMVSITNSNNNPSFVLEIPYST